MSTGTLGAFRAWVGDAHVTESQIALPAGDATGLAVGDTISRAPQLIERG